MHFSKRSTTYIILGGISSIAILALLFLYVFNGKIILPQFLSVGPVQLRAYGIILATAVLAGYILARYRAARYGLLVDAVENIVLITVIMGFIGARLYHVISDFELYRNNLFGIFAVWQGGLSIFGAVAGGCVGLWTALQLNGMRNRVLELLDWLAPSMAIGQAIGRFGNLFNYEAYGLPTNLPWKMFVPPQLRIPPYEQFQFFHPLFLYESLASLLLAAALLYLSNARSYGPGFIFGVWLGSYGAIRLMTELLRLDKHLLLGLPFNLNVAGVMVFIGVLLVLRSRKQTEKNNFEETSHA